MNVLPWYFFNYNYKTHSYLFNIYSFKDESNVFSKIRRNGLAKFKDPHGGYQEENCDILKI